LKFQQICFAIILIKGMTRQRGTNRVLRGGSWNNNGKWLRAANRNHNSPDNRNNNLGFRLAAARRGQVHGDQCYVLSLLLFDIRANPRELICE